MASAFGNAASATTGWRSSRDCRKRSDTAGTDHITDQHTASTAALRRWRKTSASKATSRSAAESPSGYVKATSSVWTVGIALSSGRRARRPLDLHRRGGQPGDGAIEQQFVIH